MWPNPQEIADLVTLTGEILNGKLQFLYSEMINAASWNKLKLPWCKGIYFPVKADYGLAKEFCNITSFCFFSRKGGYDREFYSNSWGYWDYDREFYSNSVKDVTRKRKFKWNQIKNSNQL